MTNYETQKKLEEQRKALSGFALKFELTPSELNFEAKLKQLIKKGKR